MNPLKRLGLLLLLCCICVTASASQEYASSVSLLESQGFSDKDAVLLVDEQGKVVYQWRAEQLMVPASLAKLATAQLAIKKLGLDYRFYTEFYRVENQLWIKGYGDPYLVSEELDHLVAQLGSMDLTWVRSLHIDSSYFLDENVPGRTTVNDPYNAPLSAVAANFNTVMLRKAGGKIKSGEPQTPLTPLAITLAKGLKNLSSKSQRINLINRQNAQTNMAQILLAKLQQTSWPIFIDQQLPEQAELILRYQNTHSVRDIIRGMLEYSNNFMANQLFLSLADSSDVKTVSFEKAMNYAHVALCDDYAWRGHRLLDGSGLSRQNRLSATQIDDLLNSLQAQKRLFKKMAHAKAEIYAKTGTLSDVRSYAGFINVKNKKYRFVFLFNRKVEWRYRESLLEKLVNQLYKDLSEHSDKQGSSNLKEGSI
ncbi:MAG: D-alanyl-D-alanine carboxypeptidase [Acidiferrobacterales bacterium]|nr:D-alanyl-D-alanine carboxypeptidase [Acidiferrobacterales bacterium]